jgi:hypothetical protein
VKRSGRSVETVNVLATPFLARYGRLTQSVVALAANGTCMLPTLGAGMRRLGGVAEGAGICCRLDGLKRGDQSWAQVTSSTVGQG